MKRRVIECFSCSGGMALGAKLAGLEIGMAFDWKADACASYAANLGHAPIGVDVRDLLRMVESGWTPGVIDLLIADPPCTPWSRAGKRKGVNDERDMLHVTIDLVRLLRPRAYLIGNVPGMGDAPNWPTVQHALAPLIGEGYCIRDFASLDAANYGVPQNRVRPFWFGHLGGPCIAWPRPTHGDPGDPAVHSPLPGLGDLLPWVTCRQALQHLPLEQLGRPVRMKPRGSDAPPADDEAQTTLTVNAKHPANHPDRPSPTIAAKRRMQSGEVLAMDRTENPNMPPADADAPHRTVTSQGQHVATLAWPWDRPSTTIARDPRIPPPGHKPENWGALLSGPNAVLLSEQAAAILQGLPPGWRFEGKTKASRWSQLGQAMPPPLAEAVLCAVRAQIEATS